MPDFLKSAFAPTVEIHPVDVILRLAAALLLGLAVAATYRRARGPVAAQGSFPGTLVLLTVLIAMVTQVIGDNVARAFSLVGALSIVRFRTVVRDTQDTAYVIFAVVLGMAVGAHNLLVAAVGFAVVGFAAWLLSRSHSVPEEQPATWHLNLRLALGLEVEALAGAVLSQHLARRELVSVETVRQGIAVDYIFEAHLRPGADAAALVKELNRLEGVQGVSLQRRGFEST